jgi:dihydroorotate dehydrogenase
MVPDVTSEKEPAPSVISEVIPKRDEAKVIFATGGITNGKQALDVLKAGADVVSLYTALVYGGVGTISRIKDEMRSEIKKANETRKK